MQHGIPNSTICAVLTLPLTVNDWSSSFSSLTWTWTYFDVGKSACFCLYFKFKYWTFTILVILQTNRFLLWITQSVHRMSDNPVWTRLSDNNIIMAVRLERNLCRSYLSWLSRVLVNVAFRKWGGLRGQVFIFRTTDSGIIIGRKIGLGKIISRDAKLWTVILFNVQWEIYDCFYQENR